MVNPITLLKAGYHAVRTLRDPERLGDILDLAPLLVPPQKMQRLVDGLSQTPSAALAFRERPRRGPVDLPALRALPTGTLGRTFAEFLDANQLDPASLPTMSVSTDGEYMRAHMLESHDIWHTITGFGTDVAGELGLQAFSLAQVGSPFALGIVTGGLANTLLYAMHERDTRLRAVVRGWLLGKRSRPLFGAPWASLWEVPLTEVRARYGVDLETVDALLEEPARAGLPAQQQQL